MSITIQIFYGSVVLGVCSLIHIVFLVIGVRSLVGLGSHGRNVTSTFRWFILIICAFAAIVLSHTVQVWIWAVSFVYLGAIVSIGDAIYFSIVTYTSLGYGDVTLEIDHRIFGAMAAVTGLLNFGLSAAFLVGLFTSMLPNFEKR